MTDTSHSKQAGAIPALDVPAGSAFEPYDYIYALEQAAEFLENEEWPDQDTKAAQEAANKAAAKRIRAMADRYARKHFKPNTKTTDAEATP